MKIEFLATDMAAGPPAARSQRGAPSEITLTAIERMTDGTGMLHHGIHRVPDRRHGYCIDDNARALILTCRLPAAMRDDAERLAGIYASFVQHGWNVDEQVFREFMGYDRRWLESRGSEDSNGRSLWALGVTAASGPTGALRNWAADFFDQTIGVADRIGSPRAVAFAMLGASAMLDARPGHRAARRLLVDGGTTLASLVAASRRPDWAWFEAVLAYDNTRLPEALVRAARHLDRPDWMTTAIETLDWIVGQQTAARGHFRAIGTDSFCARYAPPRLFDQKPVEAWATVDACALAAEVTGDPKWRQEATRAFDWFAGGNDLALPLATIGDGACFDGLTPHGVDPNQGAESILALQLAACTMSALGQDPGVAVNAPFAGDRKHAFQIDASAICNDPVSGFAPILTATDDMEC